MVAATVSADRRVLEPARASKGGFARERAILPPPALLPAPIGARGTPLACVAAMPRRNPCHLRIVARPGTRSAVVALREGQEAYVGDALMLRARLTQQLDELQRRMATYRTFDEPGAGETADHLAEVALAIEELDALIREGTEAASG